MLVNSFLFCGFVSMIAQIIHDNTKLTPGHITSIFVVIGVLLDSFNIYDNIVEAIGGGAQLPITSFGHLLVKGSLLRTSSEGIMGIFSGVFDLVGAGISSAIVFGFIISLIFKPHD